MIRQVCPHCEKLVELPAESAGHSRACPECGKPISVPAPYAPAVAAGGGLSLPPNHEAKNMTMDPNVPPPPPPGLNAAALLPPPPPASANTASATPPPTSTASVPEGYSRSLGFSLSPSVLDWIPLACLLLALFLTFFTWVGAYPGGYPVYTQSAWQLLGADLSVAPAGDLKNLSDTAEWLEKSPAGLRTDWFMLPFLILLLITVVLALLERFFKNPNVHSIPGPLAWLPTIWPRRYALLTSLTALLLFFLVAHYIRGKTLNDALRRQATTEIYKAEIEEAEKGGSVKKQNAQIRVGQYLGQFAVEGTTFRCLTLVSLIAAVTALACRWWLHNRGAKPHPRVSITM